MPPRNAPNGRPNPPTIAAIKPEIANGVPTLNAVNWVGVRQDSSDCAKRCAQRKRECQHARDGNSLPRRGLPIDGAGAHGAPDQRFLEKESASSPINSKDVADNPDDLIPDRYAGNPDRRQVR